MPVQRLAKILILGRGCIHGFILYDRTSYNIGHPKKKPTTRGGEGNRRLVGLVISLVPYLYSLVAKIIIKKISKVQSMEMKKLIARPSSRNSEFVTYT